MVLVHFFYLLCFGLFASCQLLWLKSILSAKNNFLINENFFQFFGGIFAFLLHKLERGGGLAETPPPGPLTNTQCTCISFVGCFFRQTTSSSREKISLRESDMWPQIRKCCKQGSSKTEMFCCDARDLSVVAK
jgi:hypothetical protein